MRAGVLSPSGRTLPRITRNARDRAVRRTGVENECLCTDNWQHPGAESQYRSYTPGFNDRHVQMERRMITFSNVILLIHLQLHGTLLLN